MTYTEIAKAMSTQAMEAGLHKLMKMDYSRCAGATIENGFLAFYHEDGLYSVEDLKTGIITLVYARNPHKAILLVHKAWMSSFIDFTQQEETE